MTIKRTGSVEYRHNNIEIAYALLNIEYLGGLGNAKDILRNMKSGVYQLTKGWELSEWINIVENYNHTG